MSEFVVERQDAEGGFGRLFIRHAGSEAELTYRRTGPGDILALHTGVPDEMRNTGAGKALVERFVADARANGDVISSRCWFVDVMYERNPDWKDVFATATVRKDETNS